MFLWGTPPLRRLSAESPRHPWPASRVPAHQTELLLRSRRLQKESDAAVGALPGPKGLPGRHHHPHQRHAARAIATPDPRALGSLRRRSADHRSLAGLLARTLSAITLLEDRGRPLQGDCRNYRPAILALERFPHA